MPRRDRDRLLDILEAIEQIERYALSGWAEADASDPVWDAVTFRLMVVGEAANHLSEEVKARAEIDWRGVVGLRNVIAHEYFDLRREVVTKTVEADIPKLRKAVERLLAELEG